MRPIQLDPVQCCTSCASIVATGCNINLSDISVAEENCQICALLLRTVERHCDYDDELNIRIVRERSKLKTRSERPRILRLCSDTEYSDDPSNDIQISLPLLPEAKDPIRFALLRAWLRWCDESHRCNNHDPRFKAALPTRLLCVEDPDILRLYCPGKDDTVKYVTLSHCWGKHPPTKDDPQFCTTDDNIKARLNGFSFSELPKTFQDAVQVTRELGIQYLWIDSLCIIQWNREDWDHEAKRMEGVFASAYCTIAATSAIDSEAGFLKRNVSNECVLVQDALGRRFYICADTDDSNNHVDIDDFDDHVEKAPLNTRAWVMQERVLSRRTIHFSDKQMYWECGEGVYCETLTRLESSFRKTYFMLDPNFPARLLALGDRPTMEFIHFLSEAYSKRHLTQKTDRCVAISGLEASIAHAIGCESRSGIFQRFLHRNLLWQRSDGKLKRIRYENRTVPSWSWMAYYGGIQFMEIPFGTVYWINNLQFDKECEIALIADVGKFLNCTMQADEQNYAVICSGGMKRGWIQYDVEEGRDIYKERCVVVGRVNEWEDVDEDDDDDGGDNNDKNEDEDEGLKEYYILVVRPTRVNGEFRRVGVGSIQSDYVMRHRRKIRVV